MPASYDQFDHLATNPEAAVQVDKRGGVLQRFTCDRSGNVAMLFGLLVIPPRDHDGARRGFRARL